MFRGAHATLDRAMMRDLYTRAAVSEPASIVRVGSVEIFPVNLCPQCGTVMPDAAVAEWFARSTPSREFSAAQTGKTRLQIDRLWKTQVETVPCKSCGLLFQPSTIVSDGSDGAQTPAYCRCQTIQHLIDWFIGWTGRQIQLFSVKTGMVRFTREATRLYWDVFLNPAVCGLANCPADITANILRYTALRDIQRMIAGDRGSEVFGGQDFSALYSSDMVFGRN
jgi:hypothetical protein